MSFYQKRVITGMVLLLCFLVDACTSSITTPSAAKTPVIVEKATSSPISGEPASMLTDTVQPTRRITPTPRRSLIPSRTVFVNLKATETQYAFEAFSTQVLSFRVMCDDYDRGNPFLSPNNNWLVIPCNHVDGQTLELVSKQDKRWLLEYKDYLPESEILDGVYPGGALKAMQWTSDENYLYFKLYLHYSEGGTCFYGYRDSGLFRINLNTGVVTTILPFAWWLAGYEIRFSPDGDKIAYHSGSPIYVLDLKAGEKTAIDVRDRFFGNLTWSPDSSELAYATCIATQDGWSVEKSSIQIYSIDTQPTRTIYNSEDNFLSIDVDNGSEQLKIVEEDNETGSNLYAYFDWASHQLILPTITPTP